MRLLVEKIKSIKVFDPKSEYADIAVKIPDFLVLNWRELRFNPLVPPPNVPQNEWYQVIVSHLQTSFNFWIGAASMLLRVLWRLTDRMGIPTLSEVLTGVENEKPVYHYKDSLAMATLHSRLELLLNTLREVLVPNSNMIEILSVRRYILQTSGLMPEIESWLQEFLLIWEFQYRIWNPGKRFLSLHVMDEVQHRLFSGEKERNVVKISASYISMLVDQARAMNMALCSLSQEPSSLINAALNNSYLKVTFILGSGSEVSEMQRAMRLTEEQADEILKMETGEAIVRMAGGYMEPFPVKVREFESPRNIDWMEFWKHQAEMKRQLYLEAGVSVEGKVGAGGNNHADSGSSREEWDVLG